MEENRKEELLTRWMDGTLTEAERKEFGPFLADHPEWEAEREAFLKMREELRAALPADLEPPYPDFFNTHLERLIRESRSALGEASKPGAGLWRMLSWWLAPAAAAAVVLAFLAGMRIGGPREGAVLGAAGVAAPAVYSPVASVQVEAVRDESFGGTVIVLEGLEDIPSSVDLLEASSEKRGPERYYISTGAIY